MTLLDNLIVDATSWLLVFQIVFYFKFSQYFIVLSPIFIPYQI